MIRLNGIDATATLRELVAQRSSGRGHPYVVAIDGRSGTGKSTLASALVERLDAAIIDGDGFFTGGVELRTDDPRSRAAHCIDWRLQREIILTLCAGRTASWLPFDWNAFDGSLSTKQVHVESKPVLILEGVYSARPELSSLIDLRILLSTPEPVRVQRLNRREGGIGPWERQWHEAEDWYFQHAASDQWFDIIVENQ
jgi:uridine kinase